MSEPQTWSEVGLSATSKPESAWASVGLKNEEKKKDEPREIDNLLGVPKPGGPISGFNDLVDDMETDLVGDIGAGIVNSIGGLMSLGARYFEQLGEAGQIPWNLAESAITGQTPKEVKLLNTVHQKIDEYTKDIAEGSRPKDQGFGGKVVETVTEYALPTRMITSAQIAKGSEILKTMPAEAATDPVAFKAWFDGLKRIPQALVLMAKDPNAAMRVEQSISAAQAATGATISELYPDAPWYVRLLAELGIGFTGGMAATQVRKGLENVKVKYGGGKEQYGQQIAGKYLDKVIAEDPNFDARYIAGDRLSKDYGVEMDVAEKSANVELKGAKRALRNVEEGEITQAGTRYSKQVSQVNESEELSRSPESIADAQRLAMEQIDAAEETARNAMESAHQQFIDIASSPISRESSGRSVVEALDQSRSEIKRVVDKAYAEVGNPAINPKNTIAALRQAKASPLKNDPYMGELETTLTKPIEATLLGKSGESVEKGTVRKFRLGQNEKPVTEVPLEAMRAIESRLKEKIRMAKASGEYNKARLLTKMLQGVYADYRATTNIGAEDIRKLRRAANLSKLEKDLFDQGEALALSRVSNQGVEMVSVHDVVDHLIRGNNQKNIEKTVDDFFNAYANRYSSGSMEDARKYLRNGFAVLVSEAAQKGETAVRKLIENHSRFLKRAGIYKDFANIGKAIEISKTAQRNYDMIIKDHARSQLAKMANTDDPVGYVMGRIKDGSIRKLNAEIGDNPILRRGVSEAAWEGVWNEVTKGKPTANLESSLNADSLRTMITRKGGELELALGKQRFKQAKDLMGIIDRIQPVNPQARGIASERYDEELVEKLMTGLRAAAHGFVRPDLIVVQAALRGKKAISIKEAQKHLMLALNDKDYADQIIKLSRSPMGKQVIRTLFGSMVAPVAEKAYNDEGK